MANIVHARAPVARAQRIPVFSNKRISRVPVPEIVQSISPTKEEADEELEVEPEEDVMDHMDIEVDGAEASILVVHQEVEAMIGVEDTSSEEEEVEETAKVAVAAAPRVWPDVSTDKAIRYRKEVNAIREVFEDEVDMYDTTMVSEYAEEIFDYMCDLEVLSPRFPHSLRNEIS